MSKVNWLNRSMVMSPYFCLVTSEAEFHSACKHIKLPIGEWPSFITAGADATAHHFENPDGKVMTVVALHPRAFQQDRVSVYGVLIHEAVHIWQNYCKSIGETDPSVEFEAYSIQHISQTLIEQWDSVYEKEKNKEIQP